MAYTKVWKRNEDGTFSALIIHERRYLEVEARLHREMIPHWITDDPMTEDFDIWAESIPRYETEPFLEKYGWMDELPIIETLESEGAIGKGSYKQPSGGYGESRTHGSAIQENADYHRHRKLIRQDVWHFSESDISSDKSWYAPIRPSSAHATRRDSYGKRLLSEDGMLCEVSKMREGD